MPIDRRDPAGRTQSRGRCHLYVLPVVVEDLLKLGFSRDPLARLQQLHPRWYEQFDLDRAFTVETESVPDARRLELRFRRDLDAYNAPRPLTMREDAGGAREWYRGAYDVLEAASRDLEGEGYTRHAPLRPWLQAALQARAELLFDWTSALGVEDLETPRPGGFGATSAQTAVRDALGAFDALDIDLAPWLPEVVLRWHRASR
ncbi:GIY-YIG nuclease family protein [Noviluteimonas gilva]|uniref:GIY-YIG nuclease family protein n=1 Tax=Noviluteimonas gilva TaxID=2682097 RepID=A0A7C9LJ33_9GAMM|nr:GIY-YIG nuclease family protein [Lysobacter gilvus]MUV14419.1 GIY-YIG nuclease family protein [Lysobacter gilvus]